MATACQTGIPSSKGRRLNRGVFSAKLQNIARMRKVLWERARPLWCGRAASSLRKQSHYGQPTHRRPLTKGQLTQQVPAEPIHPSPIACQHLVLRVFRYPPQPQRALVILLSAAITDDSHPSHRKFVSTPPRLTPVIRDKPRGALVATGVPVLSTRREFTTYDGR